MARYDYDIGILGGGAAGLTVAAGCAQLGGKVLLVEKEERLGGDCLHYGCVPSKTLIRTAKVWHLAGNTARFGLPGLERPPVDFSRVAARIASVIAAIQEHDSVERFCGLGVRVEFGDAAFMDEHQIRLGGKTFSAAKWVLSTGSSPMVPPLPGLRETPHITNKEIFSLEELPASMIVLGGGPVAIEMAQAFARLGTQVQVVQRSSHILSEEDPDLAEMVRKRLEEEGVVFHLGTRVTKVADVRGRREVVFTDASGRERAISAERLLVALGRSPNVQGLQLENAGVEHGVHGIDVDERMRSNQSHIFACGDVTGRHQFTHAAGYEGGVVVTNAMFHLPRSADYTYLPWCTYSDPELASIGLNEKRAKQQGVEVEVWREEFSGNDRAHAEGETTGLIKMLLDSGHNPVGVQILGPHAGELISEWVAALNGSVKLSHLVGAIHPYPTLSEINKRVAGNYLGTRIFSEKVRKVLKFFFNYKGRACEAGVNGEESA